MFWTIVIGVLVAIFLWNYGLQLFIILTSLFVQFIAWIIRLFRGSKKQHNKPNEVIVQATTTEKADKLNKVRTSPTTISSVVFLGVVLWLVLAWFVTSFATNL